MGTAELRLDILKDTRSFLERNKQYLKGRVLDYGCGTQPYRDLVDGQYIPYDEGYWAIENDLHYKPYTGHFDCVLFTSVIMYFIDPIALLKSFHTKYLVMTCTVNWHEGNKDLVRYTLKGLHHVLKEAGYKVLVEEPIGKFTVSDVEFIKHYGIVAEKL